MALNDNTSQRKRYNASSGLDYDLDGGHSIFLSSLFGQTKIDNENRNVNFRIRTTSSSIGGGTSEDKINLYNASLTGRHPFNQYHFSWKATFV